MSFLEKCHFHHDSNKLYEKPRMSDPVFYVQHYAGRIKYNVSSYQNLQASYNQSLYSSSQKRKCGRFIDVVFFNHFQVEHFLDKNKDTLRSDVIELLCESKNRVSTYALRDLQWLCL